MPPIDPLAGPKLALEGAVVTMDAHNTVLEHGIVYLDAGRVVDVRPHTVPPPDGFADTAVHDTDGTIFPGLIELHNHLPYNVLTLWNVPEPFPNRGKWADHEQKQALVTDPMSVLGRSPGCIEAVIRYVECKCLLGGVTTSQGITLFSNQGSQRFYKGVVRNVEQTNDDALPEAKTRVDDVAATDASEFLKRLRQSSCLLLHLSEGVDEVARDHFRALQLAGGEWAITAALSGIHGLGLKGKEHRVLAEHGGSIVWSPLSNMLLYGATLKLPTVANAGVRLALGSDWSPTGSKSLLGELKVARLESERQGGVFDDRALVAMVTRNPAAMLGWQDSLGSIEAGKYADLVVIAGRKGDPFSRLIEAGDTDVALVMIGGVPRYGRQGLMRRLGFGEEPWRVGGARRTLHLEHESSDELVRGLTLSEARDRLRAAMRKLPELARELESPRARVRGEQWFLGLEEDPPLEMTRGTSMGRGLSTPGGPMRAVRPRAPRPPLSERVKPVRLDPLTVRDDERFLSTIEQQRNLPREIIQGLRAFYA